MALFNATVSDEQTMPQSNMIGTTSTKDAELYPLQFYIIDPMTGQKLSSSAKASDQDDATTRF